MHANLNGMSTQAACTLFCLHLMQNVEPEVCSHMGKLQCAPLQLALPWLVSAFVGHLEVDQVLLLWDRIIGFDSLLPLPLLAVAIISCRRQVCSLNPSPASDD